MISTIAGASSAWPSGGCGQAANSSSSTSNLAQLETQLFASIDTNGNGSISRSELTSFMNTLAGAHQSAGAGTNASTASSLFNALDTSGGSGFSLQALQSNIGTFVSALRSQLSTTGATPAPLATSASSSAPGGAQHRHHGHGHGSAGGVNALLAALQQATSGTGGTSTSGVPTATLNATA